MRIAIGHQVLHGAEPFPRSLDRERQEDSEKEGGRTRKVANHAHIAPIGAEKYEVTPTTTATMMAGGATRSPLVRTPPESAESSSALLESHRRGTRSARAGARGGSRLHFTYRHGANDGFYPEVEAIDIFEQNSLILFRVFIWFPCGEERFRCNRCCKRTQCEQIANSSPIRLHRGSHRQRCTFGDGVAALF